MLTRDQILAAGDASARAVAPVPVPEWGGTVYVRLLDLPQALAWSGEQDTARKAALLVRFAVADEEGNPLFTDEDLDWLARQPQLTLQRVSVAALEHNGLTRQQGQAAAGN